jgi:hypothetical protein
MSTDDNGSLECSDGPPSTSTTPSVELETPYNSNEDVPAFCGLLFQLDVYSNLTITSLDLDVRFPSTTTSTAANDASSPVNVNVNRPKVDVYYRRGPYTAAAAESGSGGGGGGGAAAASSWLSNSANWTHVYRGKAYRDSNRTEGIKLSPANFTSIQAQSGEIISLYVAMKGPFVDSTANALLKAGEALVVGNDFRINVGSGLTDVDFPQFINTTIDPGFAGVVHYHLQSDVDLEPSAAATAAPCVSANNATDHRVPNVTITELVFPMLWSSNGTNVTIDAINLIVEQAMQQYLKRWHRPGDDSNNNNHSRRSLQSNIISTNDLVQVGNATTNSESGWMYTGMCPETFEECPPPAASTTTFRFQHDATAYAPSLLLYDLYHAHQDMVTALNAALAGRSSTAAGYGVNEDDDDDGGLERSPTHPHVAYAGPVPAQLRFDMTLALPVATTTNKGKGTDDATDDANGANDIAANEPRLDSIQLELLDGWIEQYLDMAVKRLTANHFTVRNLTNSDAGTKRHVRRLGESSTHDAASQLQLLLSGTLLGLYESDRVRSAPQYATVVADAFKNTGKVEFLSFLDGQVEQASNGSSAAAANVFQNAESVLFVPTLVSDDNATSGTGATTDPSQSESALSSNTTLLIICGAVVGCVALAAAALFYYCCFCKRPAKKIKQHDATPEERAPDRQLSSRQRFELERSGSKLSDSASRRGDAAFAADRAGASRQAPKRSQSGPIGATQGMLNDARGSRSAANPRDAPVDRGVRRSSSTPNAGSSAAKSRAPAARPTGGEDQGARSRSQSFDGSPGTSRQGREIRRSRSCDDMPAIREEVNSPPRRKTRPPPAKFSSGVVPGVPTQPPRHPLKKSKSLDIA